LARRWPNNIRAGRDLIAPTSRFCQMARQAIALAATSFAAGSALCSNKVENESTD